MKKMDIVFLLDRSGSMGGMESDTIGGYNSYLENQKKNDVNITTILFDHEFEILHNRVPNKKVSPLTEKEYFVRGCTALYDALGKSIRLMEDSKPEKVMFVITTDGLENASKEFTKDQIKEMIQGHSDWEFLYVGANIDSYKEGSSIGIQKKNIANYKKDKKGMNMLFRSLSSATSSFYESESIMDDWKSDLENYIKENKKD